MICFPELIEDGIFAAIAAIGFASISNPPRRIFPFCAGIAAAGHMTRYVLMNAAGYHIILSGFVASLVIGVLALPAARRTKVPVECMSFPALLPMVPGMYAYRTVQSLVKCLGCTAEPEFMHYMYLLKSNWMTCILTMIAMVLGVTLPVLLFKRHYFKAIR